MSALLRKPCNTIAIPLSLRAPVAVRSHLDLAKSIALGSGAVALAKQNGQHRDQGKKGNRNRHHRVSSCGEERGGDGVKIGHT